MTVEKAITAKLEEFFAEMDAEVLASSKEWAKGRVDALREFKASDEVAERRKQKDFSWWYYPRMFAICGGKTWYNVFNGRNEEMINDFVTKNCAAIAQKRNASIVRKMVKAGVTEVTGTEYTRTRNGFDGFFVINTTSGTKRVSINTIRAGGYNIQCLHLRVLVKVK